APAPASSPEVSPTPEQTECGNLPVHRPRELGCTCTPRSIRCDNGPELTSLALTAWCETRRITWRYIQPSKPSQNAFIERFNRTYRTEILDAYVFASVTEVRELTSDWLDRYNTRRPHDSRSRAAAHLPIGIHCTPGVYS
ncbi:MAG: putative transposase orfB for insertion sequence element, partial [Gemmatimonadetes bacterium]|nr:putative transposase orfB for insertion sequence element [Gemmatimonadota bacterium]